MGRQLNLNRRITTGAFLPAFPRKQPGASRAVFSLLCRLPEWSAQKENAGPNLCKDSVLIVVNLAVGRPFVSIAHPPKRRKGMRALTTDSGMERRETDLAPCTGTHYHSAIVPSAFRQTGFRQRCPSFASVRTFSSLTEIPRPLPPGAEIKPS